MVYFILYTVGMILFGFVFGFTVKALRDRDIIHSLERQKASLHRQLANKQKVERIEIIDNRAEPESYFAPF